MRPLQIEPFAVRLARVISQIYYVAKTATSYLRLMPEAGRMPVMQSLPQDAAHLDCEQLLGRRPTLLLPSRLRVLKGCLNFCKNRSKYGKSNPSQFDSLLFTILDMTIFHRYN